MPSLRDLIVVHGTGDRCTLTVLGSAVALAQGSRAWAESAAEALRTAIAQYLVRNGWQPPSLAIEDEVDDPDRLSLAVGELLAQTTELAAMAVMSFDIEKMKRVRAVYARLSQELGGIVDGGRGGSDVVGRAHAAEGG
jgi:hypothetical protein